MKVESNSKIIKRGGGPNKVRALEKIEKLTSGGAVYSAPKSSYWGVTKSDEVKSNQFNVFIN